VYSRPSFVEVQVLIANRNIFMAAVSLSPLPITLSTMSGRRAPLSNNPNAANSPYRATLGAASKQKRSYATIQREEPYGQPPPSKRQMLESHQTLRTPPRQHSAQSSFEGRVVTRKPSSQQSTLERNGMAVREKPRQAVVKAEKAADESQAETIRQWQKHYRKIFPTFVFYFESVPEETRIKLTKHCVALGAVSSISFLL
jgi:regulatory subunit for Cdc7p protein kinase